MNTAHATPAVPFLPFRLACELQAGMRVRPHDGGPAFRTVTKVEGGGGVTEISYEGGEPNSYRNRHLFHVLRQTAV